MSPESAIILMVMVLLGLTVATGWPIMSGPYREPPRPPEPAPKMPEIPPLDPMVPCPKCQLMGYHPLEFVRAQPPAPITSYTDLNGDTVDIYTWQSAAGISAHYRRECIFCTHVWSVPVGAG